MPYRTTAAYVSGAICGHMWMPNAKAGLPMHDDLRPRFDRLVGEGVSFRDALLSLLCERGGDFQNPAFSADTVVRIERRKVEAQGYTVHVFEREISDLPDCADLVDDEVYAGDFFSC